MNRLVIIGNGFDLAHGLPTGYCDFIDWYWKEWITKIELFDGANASPRKYSDTVVEINLAFKVDYYNQMLDIESEFAHLKNYDDLNSFIKKYSKENEAGDPRFRRNNCSLKFNNSFFNLINQRRSIQKWVDIENEYYKLLKDCLKDEDNSKVKKLNQEFEQVKNLLEEYLEKGVTNKYDFKLLDETIEIIEIFDTNYRIECKQKFLLEFNDNDQKSLMDWIDKKNNIVINFNNKPDVKNLFLNFNYTPTALEYIKYMNQSFLDNYGESELIQIHGKLNDVHNPINFGFGDEMDDDYKTIEKKDDNEYLTNIKSFQYLQNSNYKSMLSFIESERFQVYIMGHSCGLSDRILLNKIFEHKNCSSIKVFYHKFTIPRLDGRTDNYTEIIQNVSRHFNNKELMRERIVNKNLCQPLPQIKLPLK